MFLDSQISSVEITPSGQNFSYQYPYDVILRILLKRREINPRDEYKLHSCFSEFEFEF